MHGRSVSGLAAATAVAAAAASTASGLTADPAAAAAPSFQVINATVTAAADHERVGTSAFPNFPEGAVDNYYPLAEAHIDSAPSASSEASPADTGPLGQSVAAEEGIDQPQYATAQYPPGSSNPSTAGKKGGPYAEALAVKNKARAYATEASADTSTSGAAGVRQLNTALDAWRTQHLTAQARNQYPPTSTPDASPNKGRDQGGTAQPAAQPSRSSSPEPSPSSSSEPRGTDGLTANGYTTFDPTQGMVTAVGDSRVAQASFAQGLVQLRGIHVHVEVTNDGTPTRDVAVEIGAAEINGVPVTIDHNGVAIAGNRVPTTGTTKQANAALNRVLTKAGVHIRAVQPQTKTSGNRMTVHATGVQIAFRQIFSPPGAPEQDVQHTLGEVTIDSLAVPGTARAAAPVPPVTDTGGTGGNYTGTANLGTGGGADSSGGRQWVPGTPGSAGLSAGNQASGQAGGAPPAAAPTPQVASSAAAPADKPLWLLLLYFLWQSAVIGAAASLWWWRMGATGAPGGR